jgi:hypothetical protein
MRYLSLTIFFISFYLIGYAHFLKTRCNVQQTIHIKPTAGLNRAAFYKAMQENDKSLVNAQLEELKSTPADLRQAFTGAMLMKRASFVGSPASRLHYFKEGHKMLESSIQQYPENAEFRFLRLMVQEHAPGALGYKTDIEKDCGFIKKNYKSLPEDVQAIIKDYSKKSKFLKLDVS